MTAIVLSTMSSKQLTIAFEVLLLRRQQQLQQVAPLRLTKTKKKATAVVAIKRAAEAEAVEIAVPAAVAALLRLPVLLFFFCLEQPCQACLL